MKCLEHVKKKVEFFMKIEVSQWTYFENGVNSKIFLFNVIKEPADFKFFAHLMSWQNICVKAAVSFLMVFRLVDPHSILGDHFYKGFRLEQHFWKAPLISIC